MSQDFGFVNEFFFVLFFFLELDSVELLVAVCHQYKICEIRQFGIDGEDEKMLVSPVSSGITGKLQLHVHTFLDCLTLKKFSIITMHLLQNSANERGMII